jgi:hypothetical protein
MIHGFTQYLVELPSHLIGMTAFLLLLGLPLSWRSSGPPERATILTLIGLAIMDLLIWLYSSGSALLHFAADGLALSWILSVALRANRVYPAVIAAILLVAVLAQLLGLLGLARSGGTLTFLANGLHFMAILAYLTGATIHRRMLARGVNRPAWRGRSSHG